MKGQAVSRSQAADIAWNAAVEEMLRAINARIPSASDACRQMLAELRSELTLLLRPGVRLPNANTVH